MTGKTKLVRNIESQTVVQVSSMKFARARARDTFSLGVETVETFVPYGPIFFVELPYAVTLDIRSIHASILRVK